ncbi:MAG TPA: CBS domain-containing protein [Trebonia sp.]|nr:CBS domain-containing protein [Trebonia sp.]
MEHRQVREVMTTKPVTVLSATSLKSLAGILVNLRVDAVPVLSAEGKVLGLITEMDLLKKEELQQDLGISRRPRRSSQRQRLIAAAETAGELMTTHPVTVRPDTPVAEAARLMERHQVGCLPVVDESGKLLGLAGPRELLRVLLRPDAEIKSEVISQVLTGYLGTNPLLVRVEVSDGVVRMSGELERKSMLSSVLPAVRAIDGVIDVEGEFTYAIDDTRLPASR